MKERTYYESDEYEDQANPGTYAAIVITRDHGGPRFKFMSGELTILDLAIPACESLAIARQLAKAAGETLDAAEWAHEILSGPHEAPAEITGRREPYRVPPSTRYEMPPELADSRVRQPGAVRVGPLPAGRSTP